MHGHLAIRDMRPTLNSGVRSEYLNLPKDLRILTRCFGIALPAQARHDATVLIFSIECLDRHLDVIPGREGRARFSAAVLASLNGEARSTDCGGLPPELRGWLTRLEEVAARCKASRRFCLIAADLLSNSETMRTTRDSECYIGCAVREGGWIVELLLLVIGRNTTPGFDQFMRRLAGPANLVDKLRDAKVDYAHGEIGIRPTVWFRWRLSCAMLRRTLLLARFCMGNATLLRWGIQSVWTELIRFGNSEIRSRSDCGQIGRASCRERV